MLPLALYSIGRAYGKWPEVYNAALGLSGVMYLFDRSYTIDGGNLASTFAGEFSFSLSLSIGLFALAIVIKGIDSIARAIFVGVLMGLALLAHIVPVPYIAALMGLVLLLEWRTGEWRYLVFAGILALLLDVLWIGPFFLYIDYTTSMGWQKVTNFSASLFPHYLLFVAGLAILGFVLSFYRKCLPVLIFAIGSILAMIAFVYVPNGALYNARMLPFWFLGMYVVGGLTVVRGIELLVSFLASPAVVRVEPGRAGENDEVKTEIRISTRVVLSEASQKRIRGVAFFGFLVYFTAMTVSPLYQLPKWTGLGNVSPSFVREWASWNYSGYETKPAWPEYHALVTDMSKLSSRYGCGRAMWEYNSNQGSFGTPEALMLLPYWTNNCVDSMEGLFFESSSTTPYHFLNQSELSQSPSDAMAGLPYEGVRVNLGIKHLQELGVRYYMAFSPMIVEEANQNKNLQLIYTQKAIQPNAGIAAAMGDTWNIYLVKGASEVTALKYAPIKWQGVTAKKWLAASLSAYADPNGLIYTEGGPSTWQSIKAGSLNVRPRLLEQNRVTRIHESSSTISFHVSRVGVPVVVHTSYFPNWQSSSVSGIYRGTPNEMVVIPTQHNVTLSYGYTLSDIIFEVISLLGWFGVIGYFIRRQIKMRTHKNA
jgi:hypothetical protein